MVVLIDTNVVMDYITTREPFFDDASKVFTKCISKELDGYVAFHSVADLWYLMRKMPEKRRRHCLQSICDVLTVCAASHGEVVRAVEMADFEDFEDCLQDRCAEAVGADYIITRNVEDFACSVVPAITPEKFLEMIDKTSKKERLLKNS